MTKSTKKSKSGKGDDLKLSKSEEASSDAALNKFWAKQNAKAKKPAKKG